MHKTERKSKQSPLCCLGCLSTDCRLYDIHEHKVDKAFERITNTLVSPEMPQHLCLWCLTLLRKCDSFRDMCVRTQHQLTELKRTMDADAIQRCHSPQTSFHLSLTKIEIVDYVPSSNDVMYGHENVLGDVVKDEPEIKFGNSTNECQKSFILKQVDNKKRHNKNVISENVSDTDHIFDNDIQKIGNLNKIEPHENVLDVIEPDSEIKFDHEDNVIEINDLHDNDEVDFSSTYDNAKKEIRADEEINMKRNEVKNNRKKTSKIKSRILLKRDTPKKRKMDNITNETNTQTTEKNNQKKTNKITNTVSDKEDTLKKRKVDKTDTIKANHKKLNSKDGDVNNDNIKCEDVLEDSVCVRRDKCVKPRRKKRDMKVEYIRHPTDGYMLFDFASFESANAVKVVVLSKEEQLAEIASRKKSRNYLESPFKCGDCGRGYLLDAVYTSHRARHHSPSKKHACDICGMRFKSNYLRQSHQDKHRLQFQCNQCEFVSRSKYQAKMHHEMHAGKTYECPYCGMSFKKRSSHLSHVRLVHPGHNVVCGECGETFIGEKGLKDHKARKHPETLKSQQFNCDTCSANFCSVSALTRHTDLGEHSGRPCERCGDHCASETELREHVREKHHTESHHCEECAMTFLNSAAYDTHVWRKHLGKRSRERYPLPMRRWLKQRCEDSKPSPTRAVCDQCGHVARNSSLLVYHMRSHLEVKPFACAHCPKTFVIQAKLNWHMRTHTGEKPYQCSSCPAAFSLKGNLSRHIKTVHLKNYGNFPCSICDREFKTRAVLKMHVKTIHEGMPWPKRVRRAKGSAPAIDNK